MICHITSELIYNDEELLALLLRRDYSVDQIENFHRWKLDDCFFDVDHFTKKGHRVVASRLFD